jgi:hypothetical protein
MLKHHEYINNEQGRVNTRVNFPINGFAPNQGLENVETTTEYNLFAAICHKESRDKTSGHYTAQCKIKDSNNHWIEYNDADFESNTSINQRNRTKAKVKYYPLAYFLFLFYIKRNPAVSPEIGLQVQDNNGVSQLLVDAHDNEQHHGDLITNEQQDVSVCEDINQVDGTNVCNQSVPKDVNRITNVDQSSANNSANLNPRVQQTNCTVINVDDDESNEDDDTCALCLRAICSDADRGYADTDGQCQCLYDYHYDCLKAMWDTNEWNRMNMKCA